MNKNRLKWLIRIREDEYDRKKFKRMIFAILLYTVFWLYILYAQNQLDTRSILHVAVEIVACVFLGGVTFFVNALIFNQLYSISDSENKEIERLKNQLKEMEQQEQNKHTNYQQGETK